MLVAAGLAVLLVVVGISSRERARPTETASAQEPVVVASLGPLASAPRGAIRGTVADEHGAPIEGARVCRSETCVTSGADGAFGFAELGAGRYTVAASAPRYVAASVDVTLAAGEDRADVALVLASGAVEVTGVVSDASGGVVPGARVWDARTAEALGATTDDAGHYSLWVAPGAAGIEATADGYVTGSAYADAPGTVDITLVAAASVSGVVVDAATGAPRAGVAVQIVGGSRLAAFPMRVVTDDAGRFAIDKLAAGAYGIEARARDGFGHVANVAVGIGAHTGDVVVELHRAYRLEGIVAAGTTPCRDAKVQLSCSGCRGEIDEASAPDGAVAFDGLLPATYRVLASCPGHYTVEMPTIVIADRDVVGQTWQVRRGGTIRGRVRTHGGEPARGYVRAIDKAMAKASRDDELAVRNAFLGAELDASGKFAITGVVPGHFRVLAGRGAGTASTREVDIAGDETVEVELELPDEGVIEGVVVDPSGKPVGDVHVIAMTQTGTGASAHSGRDGAFRIAELVGGDYTVTVARPREQVGELTVHVDIGRTTTARVVIAAPSAAETGAIRGVVVDERGAAAGDVYVYGFDEESRHRELVPVLAGPDGSFAFTSVAPGTYKLVAMRPQGGGRATAEHVAVGASSVRLELEAAASVEGTVRNADGSVPEDFVVRADGRVERMFHTGGRFVVRGLAPGETTIVIDGHIGEKRVVVLAPGEAKTGVDFALATRVELHGRVLDPTTHDALRGVFITDGESSAMTSADGTFVLRDVAVGAFEADLQSMQIRRTVHVQRTIPATARGSYDVGDIELR